MAQKMNIILFALLGVSVAVALETKILAQTEDCYTERVNAGGSITFRFDVIHGGKKDLNVRLLAMTARMEHVDANAPSEIPVSQVIVQEWTLATHGVAVYAAERPTPPPGVANDTFVPLPVKVVACFSNKMARWTPKWYQFSFVKAEVPESDIQNAQSALEHKIHEQAMVMYSLRNKAIQLRQTEEAHRDTVESTNAWIMYGTGVNAAMLVVFSLFQYWYFKKFLSVRHIAYRSM